MSEPTADEVAHLRTWIGRQQVLTDTLRPQWSQLMELTMDRPASLQSGDELPPLWHFTYFLESAPMSRLGRDGHPERGGFLPPVTLPRRMWAGGRLQFASPLHFGDEVTKTSTINDVVAKSGSSGPLCFVTVTHEYSVDGQVCLTEEQDLVYREDPDPAAPKRDPKPAPTEAAWTATVTPTEAQLFRYSALTFNSHRIHYDRDYARDVEGYPGLVFHGPLTATLLADLAARESGRGLTSFSFRAMAPLFDSAAFTISGNPDGELWAATPDGGLAMSAQVEFAS